MDVSDVVVFKAGVWCVCVWVCGGGGGGAGEGGVGGAETTESNL